MAERNIIQVIGTVSNRLPDLSIKNGQLIFIQDTKTIALDFDDKRIFYNQITVTNNESERLSLSPISGSFYFVIETAVLWYFETEWIPLTSSPQNVVFIGTKIPELGIKNVLYVDTENRNISIWDETEKEYLTVADKTQSISDEEIISLFI